MKPLVHTFRVKPDRAASHYYKVFIFRERAAMLEFWRQQQSLMTGSQGSLRRQRGEFEAQATFWGTESFRGPRKEQIGQVIFHFGQTGGETIAHEFAHAALFWIQAKGRKLDNWKGRAFKKNDEMLASAVGAMAGQFNRRWWALFPRGRWR